MRDLILSAVNPDNTPHGYNWTFAFPMLLFIVIALILWALFGRPHQRVPARRLAPGLISRTSASAAHMTASADATDAGEAADDGNGQQPNSGSAPGAGASE